MVNVLNARTELSRMARESVSALSFLRETVHKPDGRKRLNLRWTKADAAKLAGLTIQQLDRFVSEGAVPAPQEEQSPKIYTLEFINALRKHVGRMPHRGQGTDPAIIAIQNFKGGVGKSTVSVHLAQYFSQKGYRVLVVDCDSQASLTTLFGYIPDFEIKPEHTVLPYLIDADGFDDIREVIRPTYWPGLDLLPACLGLYDAEYQVAAQLRNGPEPLSRLREYLTDVADDYDIVIIDPPPALGMVSMSVMRASNALIIPAPASTLDFASTSQFLTMAANTLDELASHGLEDVDYHWVKLLPTKIDRRQAAVNLILDKIMAPAFGDWMTKKPILSSAEYGTAAVRLQSVYEHAADENSETRQRCLNNLSEVFDELDAVVRSVWDQQIEAIAPRRAAG